MSWIQSHYKFCQEREAVHFASLLASHGYIFPIDDHVMTVRNDHNTLYRFQTAYFWPSHCWAPENTDYAVYLCKRTMQNKVGVIPRPNFGPSQWLSGKMVRKLSQGSHVRIPNMWETPKMWETLCPRASPGYDTPTNPCVWTPSGFPVLKRIQKTHWYS